MLHLLFRLSPAPQLRPLIRLALVPLSLFLQASILQAVVPQPVALQSVGLCSVALHRPPDGSLPLAQPPQTALAAFPAPARSKLPRRSREHFPLPSVA